MEKISTGYEQTETVQRFERTNQVHLNLRDPLTRQEAGIAQGRNSVIVERTSAEEMLDVEFLLPEGKRLNVPAIGVVFSAAPGAPQGAQPEQIVVNRVEPSLAQAEQALKAAAEKFGFDPELVEQFVRSARASNFDYTNQVFPTQRVGYLRLSIEARENPDEIQINYSLYWGDFAREVEDAVSGPGENASAPPPATP